MQDPTPFQLSNLFLHIAADVIDNRLPHLLEHQRVFQANMNATSLQLRGLGHRSPLNNVGVIPGKLAIPPEDGSASG
jgi:hypothetical protein